MYKDIALVVLPILAAVVSWFLTRKKTRAETKLIELECAQKLIDIYKGALEEVQTELSLAREEIAKSRAEIAKLREEVETLSKLNRKLDNELKQFRKAQSHAVDK
jgi:chromosome segregation ATPase